MADKAGHLLVELVVELLGELKTGEL